VSRLIQSVARRLDAGGVESAQAEARTLLAHVAGVPLGQAELVDGLAPAAEERLDDLVRRRLTGVPLQHLLGVAHFRTITVAVGPGVFVPRPETEVVAGWAVDWLRRRLAAPDGLRRPLAACQTDRSARDHAEFRVVELCAGSGAISLALAAEVVQPQGRPLPPVPEAEVHAPAAALALWAVENSPEALVYLRRNTAGWPIRVVAADMADALAELNGTVDLVVANPPYVPSGVWPSLPREVRDHDPVGALVAGRDGLDAVRRVAVAAGRLLRPGGVVACEHDESQATSAPAVFQAAGFVDVADHADWAGRPRFVTARLGRSGQNPADQADLADHGRLGRSRQAWPITANLAAVRIDDPGANAAVAAVLARDECVVLPTDTVYGVAALASSRRGVERLQAAKGRGDDFPPPILIADLAQASALAEFGAPAQRLAEAFWPGALTLILPLRPGAVVALPGRAVAGPPTPTGAAVPGALDSVALRVPDHDCLRQLLRATGPLATSSANRHGRPPATTVGQAQAELGDRVSLYLDGGPTPGATPSTIVSFVGETRIIRQGLLDPAEIVRALGGR